MEKGKLIVSTKAAKGDKYWLVTRLTAVICLVLGIALIVLGLAFIDTFEDMGREIFSNKDAGVAVPVVAGVILVVYSMFRMRINKLQSSSYCEVYENAVCGRTGLSARHPNDPVRDFEVPIGDIVSVTEAGQTIYIQTKYESYDIMASGRRSEAVREIRARIIRE